MTQEQYCSLCGLCVGQNFENQIMKICQLAPPKFKPILKSIDTTWLNDHHTIITLPNGKKEIVFLGEGDSLRYNIRKISSKAKSHLKNSIREDQNQIDFDEDAVFTHDWCQKNKQSKHFKVWLTNIKKFLPKPDQEYDFQTTAILTKILGISKTDIIIMDMSLDEQNYIYLVLKNKRESTFSKLKVLLHKGPIEIILDDTKLIKREVRDILNSSDLKINQIVLNLTGDPIVALQAEKQLKTLSK